MVKRCRIHDKAFLWREDRKISVTADCDPPLASGRRARLGARPSGERCRTSETPTTALRPDNRQSKLQRRDAAPGRAEVAGDKLLHLRRTRRMVRDNHVERAVGETAPEPIAIGCFPNRRADLRDGSAVGDLFRAKCQIVRARLDTEADSVGDGRRIIGRASALERCRMCALAPVTRAASITSAMARF